MDVVIWDSSQKLLAKGELLDIMLRNPQEAY